MAKLVLEIKNPGRILKPERNDVIFYDGKDWYVTKKEEVFKELCSKLREKEKELDNKIKQCNEKIAEVNKLKTDVAEQLLEFGEIVKESLPKGGN